ncbi:MAG: DUF1036 domain-containing protein [Pseudomonadota bacterium]
MLLRCLVLGLASIYGGDALAQRSVPTTPENQSSPSPNNTTTQSNDFSSGWRICNKSTYDAAYVIYSYYENSEWVTRGWRRIDRDKCSVFQNEVTNKTVYFYAISDDETYKWSGDTSLCAHPTDEFEYFGDISVCENGYEIHDFRKWEIKSTVANTYNLTSN